MQSYLNYNFSFSPFWIHKIKTEAKYISTANVPHQLSTAGPVSHAEPNPSQFDCSFIHINRILSKTQQQMSKSNTLLLVWMYKLARKQSNLKLLLSENLLNLFQVTTKQAGTRFAWGTESGVLNRRSMLEILLYFTLVFIL